MFLFIFGNVVEAQKTQENIDLKEKIKEIKQQNKNTNNEILKNEVEFYIEKAEKNFEEGNKKNAGFPKQPEWFIDARGFLNLEKGLTKIGFNKNEIDGILGNNWFNFYKRMN